MAFYYAENKQLHKIIYTLLDVCASFFIGRDREFHNYFLRYKLIDSEAVDATSEADKRHRGLLA